MRPEDALHQDELPREAPYRVRELQGALREDHPVVTVVRRVRAQGGHRLVGPAVALRGDDDLIDDEFLRYMEFVTEIASGATAAPTAPDSGWGPAPRRSSATQNPQREAPPRLPLSGPRRLGRALRSPRHSTGCSRPPAIPTGDIGRSGSSSASDGGSQEPLNLFEACCRSYGATRGRTRVFSLGQSLVLYAVLLHLIEGHP